jgi:hypothetical protein
VRLCCGTLFARAYDAWMRPVTRSG